MLGIVQFRIDEQAGRPLFDQIRTQIIEAIRTGTLPPGTRLPTVRELAGELGLAVNTVARTYRELEAAGVVETRGRFGTFVARADPSDSAMAAAANAYADVARGLGLSKDEALRYLDAAFDD
ncbi:GntR family transcriptional regulator [Mycobacterium branderi]|uniref:GntR family transcriptional regulator n=1 Tax=Mycobacterium branderi TaxID=43348 RepID=A0AA91RH03_9MYCO|nr:GntR family transcriptional regulator [Mycobacterium branderi]MCV7235938.1 GntR family transcriptional regulator [Mycobacterium branderi]ORA34823.1 GntR family transcriptional regulator [Mycobacterium branderi]